jgi:hypothetical protein
MNHIDKEQPALASPKNTVALSKSIWLLVLLLQNELNVKWLGTLSGIPAMTWSVHNII